MTLRFLYKSFWNKREPLVTKPLKKKLPNSGLSKIISLNNDLISLNLTCDQNLIRKESRSVLTAWKSCAMSVKPTSTSASVTN